MRHLMMIGEHLANDHPSFDLYQHHFHLFVSTNRLSPPVFCLLDLHSILYLYQNYPTLVSDSIDQFFCSPRNYRALWLIVIRPLMLIYYNWYTSGEINSLACSPNIINPFCFGLLVFFLISIIVKYGLSLSLR